MAHEPHKPRKNHEQPSDDHQHPSDEQEQAPTDDKKGSPNHEGEQHTEDKSSKKPPDSVSDILGLLRELLESDKRAEPKKVESLRMARRSQILNMNKAEDISLGDREAILVTLLIRHALEVTAHGGEEFMLKEDLLDEIARNFEAFWHDSTPGDIDHVVYSIRKKLVDRGFSRDLIDTSTRRMIRLNLPSAIMSFAADIVLPDDPPPSPEPPSKG